MSRQDIDTSQDGIVERAYGVEFDPKENIERILGRGHDPIPGEYPTLDLHKALRRLLADDTGPRVLHDDALATRQVGGTNAVTGQAAVGTVATQIAFQRRERLTLTLVNTGTGTVFIGTTANAAQTGNGFALLPNSAFTTGMLNDIWAISASGSNTVTYWDEFRGEIER